MAENEKILNDAELGKVAGGTGEAYMESHVYFGDTLESIASWYWVAVEDIIRLNRDNMYIDINNIRPGDIIYLPIPNRWFK